MSDNYHDDSHTVVLLRLVIGERGPYRYILYAIHSMIFAYIGRKSGLLAAENATHSSRLIYNWLLGMCLRAAQPAGCLKVERTCAFIMAGLSRPNALSTTGSDNSSTATVPRILSLFLRPSGMLSLALPTSAASSARPRACNWLMKTS